MQAYCLKCKTKREMSDPTPEFTSKGAPRTRGVCPVCGTKLYRMGATPAHEGLPRPEPAPKEKKAKKKAKKTEAKSAAKSSRASSRRTKATYDGPRRGSLVIVESPAKARTVGRYLGNGYTVKASVGHIRDLYKSKLSVDIEHDFQPIYVVPRDKKKVVKELSDAVARARRSLPGNRPRP